MSALGYYTVRTLGRFVFVQTMRVKVLRGELARRPGPFILACSHLSHYDPWCLSMILSRKVDWMARIEFYRHRVMAGLMRWFDAFAVNRQGVCVSAVRTAIDRLKRGRVVGIFPEGGVMTGRDSVLRGGPIKKGAFLIALRADVPVVPCVILGTHTLTRVGPWLPFRRGRLWLAIGDAIEPDHAAPSRRAARENMARRLQESLMKLYAELREKYGVADSSIP